MKEEDRKYEEWLNEVKSKQPVMPHPEQLTADILQRVVALKKPKKRLYLLGSWLSGITAAVLLCFFLTETIKVPVHSDCEFSEFIWETRTTSTLPSNWKSMNLTEKGSYLSTRQKKLERQKELIYKNIEKKLLK